jgi:hypothetical protein
MAETGKVSLTIGKSEGKTVPGRKLIFGKGRRGPIGPRSALPSPREH